MSIQIVGNANSAAMEVELNTLAARFNVRPQDITYLGSYAAGNTYAAVNTLVGQPAPSVNFVMAVMRGPFDAGIIYLFRKILISLMQNQAATGTGAAVPYTVGLVKIQNLYQQGIVVQDGSPFAGVKQLSPSPTSQKLRTTMPDPTLDALMPIDAATGHANSIVFPGPTASAVEVIPVTFGGNSPLANMNGFGANATTATIIPSQTPLLLQRAGEMPLILEPGQGISPWITSTMPTFATTGGTLFFSMSIVWDEIMLNPGYGYPIGGY